MPTVRLRPHPHDQAASLRRLGIGATGLVSVLSGAMLVVLLAILLLAARSAGAPGTIAPVLVVGSLLAGYLVAAPVLFARRALGGSPASTGGLLLCLLAGYVLLWAGVLAAV